MRTLLHGMLVECDAAAMPRERKIRALRSCRSATVRAVHEGAVAQRDAGPNREPNSPLGIRSKRICVIHPLIDAIARPSRSSALRCGADHVIARTYHRADCRAGLGL